MRKLLGILLLIFGFFGAFFEDEINFKKLKKSAEQGIAESQYNLGNMYYHGQGVTQDYKQAVYWWQKSAEQGYVGAQLNLGLMYAYGLGVIEDYVTARMWFNISGNPREASEEIDKLSKRMTPQQIEEAQRMAREWVEKFEKKQKE